MLHVNKFAPLFLLVLLLLAGCDDKNADKLPADASKWVCQDSLIPPTQAEIDEWCEMNLDDLGEPLPPGLRNPPPLALLDMKNQYDMNLQAFIRERLYDTELGWKSDATWRMTGPYVGDIGTGKNLSTHNAIKIYYSPEAVVWLCSGRQGEIPAGAMIIKETHLINDELDITIDDEGCMVINADPEPDYWPIMVKNSGGSFDGWYWSVVFGNKIENKVPTLFIGNPPVFDRSGITSDVFFEGVGNPPLFPDPLWYPTGYIISSQTKVPDIALPFNEYGINFCMTCHGSADGENLFSSINNILGYEIRYKHYTSGGLSVFASDIIHLPGGSTISDEDFSFTSPLAVPRPDFLEFYDQLEELGYSDVWDLRLPAQTYDHIVSDSTGPPQFLTSDQCIGCHDNTGLIAPLPNMTLELKENGITDFINLSEFGEWSASPMGLAGRDPIFFSQLQGETNNLSQYTACIENLCLHCHGVMGQRQLAIDTEGEDTEDCEEFFGVEPPPGVPSGKPFRLNMVTEWPDSPDNEFQKYGALARDGVSCTVCHHIADVELGEEATYTGNFVTGPPDRVFGPYQDVIQKPMQQGLGITPRFASQITDSGLCGTCHAILLPVFDNSGERLGFSYEQTTYLEWENSVFSQPGEGFKSCQDCHMPKHFDGRELEFMIASIETNMFPPTTNRLPDPEITLAERSGYARHSLHGLNLFLNQMFQQFPIILGYRQLNFFATDIPALILGQASMIEMAQNESARVAIEELVIDESGGLRAVVNVTNMTGHYLPSGVGFRRMFLEFLVRDAEGNVLWASGRTNELGAIVRGTTEIVLPSEDPARFPDAPFQPHYQTITQENQAQIYQELVEDSAGMLTSSFLERVKVVKDNRIRPKGYDPEFFAMQSSPFIQALAVTPGQAADDPYYTDPKLTGADVVTYLVPLVEVPLDLIHDVKATLYSQSIPPSYLQQRFLAAGVGPAEDDEIRRLYYITSHLNVDDTVDGEGSQVMKDWKLFLTSAERALE